jgi:hypothetical protein
MHSEAGGRAAHAKKKTIVASAPMTIVPRRWKKRELHITPARRGPPMPATLTSA